MSNQVTPHPTALLTTEEAAAYLGVAVPTLAYWRWLMTTGKAQSSQQLPFVKVGKAVRYRMTDVHAFLQQNVQENTDEK